MNEMKNNEMKRVTVGFKIENHSNWKHKMHEQYSYYVKWNVPIGKTMKKPQIEMNMNG